MHEIKVEYDDCIHIGCSVLETAIYKYSFLMYLIMQDMYFVNSSTNLYSFLKSCMSRIYTRLIDHQNYTQPRF